MAKKKQSSGKNRGAQNRVQPGAIQDALPIAGTESAPSPEPAPASSVRSQPASAPAPLVSTPARASAPSSRPTAGTSSSPAAADNRAWLWPMLVGGGFVVFLLVGLPMLGSLFVGKKEPVKPLSTTAPSSSTAPASKPSQPAQSTPGARGPAPERGLVAMLPQADASLFGGDASVSDAWKTARADLTGGVSPMKVKNDLEALIGRAGTNPGRDHLEVAAAYMALRARDITAASNHVETLLRDFPSSKYAGMARAMKVDVALQQAQPASKGAAPDLAALGAVRTSATALLNENDAQVQAYGQYILAQILDNEGKSDDAVKAYQELASRYPDSAQAAGSLVRVGLMYQKQGNPEGAKLALRQVVEKYPNDSVTKEARKYLRELELIGQPAPELKVLSWEQGDPTSIQQLRGKVALVNFWQTWCPHCRNELPHLSELYSSKKDEGLVVLGVTRDDKNQDLANLQKFMSENPISFPIVRVEQASARDYAVTGIPAAALVDKEGIIRWRGHPGSLPQDLLETLLAAR